MKISLITLFYTNSFIRKFQKANDQKYGRNGKSYAKCNPHSPSSHSHRNTENIAQWYGDEPVGNKGYYAWDFHILHSS